MFMYSNAEYKSVEHLMAGLLGSVTKTPKIKEDAFTYINFVL